MGEFDTIIKDGTVIDGTRVPRYRADVGIKDGKIAKIGRLKSSDAAKVLDASGLIVAPGYIDLDTHYDAQIHWDPYCTMGSWHGVTSVTIGNCGFGFAPVKAKDFERSMLAFSRNESIPLEPMRVSMKVDWETLPQYMDRLSTMPLGINIGHLLPVGPAVAYVMGGVDEAKKNFPGEREMFRLKRILHEAMDAGALGWSAQRLVPESRVSVQRDYDGTPMITDILPDDFYIELAKSLGEKDDGCIQFTQSGANKAQFGINEDFRFLEQLAKESGRPVLYNAVAINDKYPDSHRAQLNWLRDANAKGLRIFGQAVMAPAPVRMTLEDWNLFDSVPAWREATVGTTEERKIKLRRPEIRQSMREKYDKGGMETRAFIFGELPKWIARKVQRPDLKDKYEGLSIDQISELEHKHVIDAMLDLTVADDLSTEWAAPARNIRAELYAEVLKPDYMIPGVSDGGAHIKFVTPGIYPTEVLAWLASDEHALTLEEAHFRLSGLPAWAAGFKDRGTLREGMAADIVVYDLNRLKAMPEEILHDLPAGEWRRVRRCEGYRWIMVNGVPIFEEGKCTDFTPGKLLRNGQAVAERPAPLHGPSPGGQQSQERDVRPNERLEVEKREINAWIVDGKPPLEKGRTYRFGVNIGKLRQRALARASLREIDFGDNESLRVLVVVSGYGFTAQPRLHELLLPKQGNTKDIFFEVTPTRADSLLLRLSLYLASGLMLLQEFEIAILTREAAKVA